MKKYLLTGGAGLLSSNIALARKDDWTLTVLSRNRALKLDGVETHYCDLQNPDALVIALSEINPDVIIHTAGMTNVEACEKNYFAAHLANVTLTKNLGEWCQKNTKKLVHISTDHFANQDIDVSTESDIGLPLNVYAETKLLSESVLRKSCPDALILRTNFFGWGNGLKSSFSEHILRKLRAQEEVTLFSDVFYTPLLMDELISAMTALIDGNHSGIFNVVSNKKISKLEFGQKLARTFGLREDLIKTGTLEGAGLTKRPSNMALDNRKLVKTLGSKFDFSVDDSLIKLRSSEDLATELQNFVRLPESQKLNHIYYGKQVIDQSDAESVLTTLLSNSITQGPRVQEFEEKISRHVGCKYAVAFNNLTTGLHAAYLAAGIGPGDYVITSPLTFVATSNAAIYCGATPLFADIDPRTLNIDPKKVEELLIKYENKVKAVVAVHFAGSACDMETLRALGQKYKVHILEDAAHALGGSYPNGRKIGNCEYSLMTGFSFHPVKNVTTGEGGVITTNDPVVYHELLRIRSHGITKAGDTFVNHNLAYTGSRQNIWYHEMQTLGFNFRLTEIQCALGITQMNKLESLMDRKREIALRYDKAFAEMPLVKTLQHETRRSSGNHLYTIRLNYEKLGITRAELYEKFAQAGVHLHVHYIPVFLQPFYKTLPGHDHAMTCQNVLDYYAEATTVPLHPLLTDADVDLIISLFRELVPAKQ